MVMLRSPLPRNSCWHNLFPFQKECQESSEFLFVPWTRLKLRPQLTWQELGPFRKSRILASGVDVYCVLAGYVDDAMPSTSSTGRLRNSASRKLVLSSQSEVVYRSHSCSALHSGDPCTRKVASQSNLREGLHVHSINEDECAADERWYDCELE